MQHLEINLLGPPVVKRDGKPIETERHKAIGLLAYLAVEAKPHRRESLAAMFWPDYPKASAYSYLRRTLWELNQVLGKGWIEAQREEVALVHKPGLTIDVELFQGYLDSSSDLVEGLTAAVRLYRGDFLESLAIADTAPFEDWQTEQSEFYRAEFSKALERLVQAYEDKQEYTEALTYAQRWTSLDRLDESAYRAVMRQLAGLGKRSEAVHIYKNCARVLRDELGIEPQEETKELYQSILHTDQRVNVQTPAERTRKTGKAQQTGYLPVPSTPFIGRSEEIQEVLRLARDPNIRLLSLIGAGGTGKTRLSIQVASLLEVSYSDGIWFIPLAAVQSTQALIQTIGKGIFFQFYNSELPARQQLLDYLREKQMLLILDNFEQLVENSRELVMDILGVAKGITLMVTSRERLNLQTEQIYRVPGMRTPDLSMIHSWENPTEQAADYSSIQLLVERARRVRNDFHLTSENLEAVAKICQLVDGSPLGIVLAGGWLELLPPEEIVQEISKSLDFLESSAADLPERQRSLRAVFNTSWKLLKADEQQAYKRLCIFSGSFSRQAALEVSRSSMRTLLNLANKSWLLQGDEGRYLLHDLVRQFGLERLHEDPDDWRETKGRQADYFATFLQVQGQALRTAGQIQALNTLRTELDNNIPDAWAWLVENEQFDTIIEKMLPGIFHYWLIRSGSMEMIGMLKRARKAAASLEEQSHLLQQTILEAVEVSFELSGLDVEDKPKERLQKLWEKVKQCKLQDKMGFWYYVLIAAYGGDLNYEEAITSYLDRMPRIIELEEDWEAGYLYILAGRFEVGESKEANKQYLLKALAIFQQLGVIHEQGIALASLADQASKQMEYEMAIEYWRRAMQYFEETGDEWGVNNAWYRVAEYSIYLGKIEQAFEAFQVRRKYSEKQGNRRMLGNNYSWESLEASRYGSLDYALEMRKKSLEIAIEVKSLNDIAYHTWELGEVYRLVGDLALAKKYFQDALPRFQQLEDYFGIAYYHRGCGEIAAAQGDWLEAKKQFKQALSIHEKDLPNRNKWGTSLYHTRLGEVCCQLGEINEARQHLKISLEMAEEMVHPDVKAIPLTGVASLLAITGQPGEAIEIAACVENQPTTWNEVKQRARKVLEIAKMALTPDEAGRRIERGKGLNIDSLCKQTLEKLQDLAPD